MRLLKLFVVLGVLAALVVPAGATNLPAAEYWGFESENREQGNVYNTAGVPAGDYERMVDPVSGKPRWYLGGIATNPELVPISTAGQTKGNEDNWGLFWLNKIETPKNSGVYKYQDPTAAGGTAIVGIFYGMTDDTITVNATGTYILDGGNLKFKLYQANISGTIQELYASLFGVGEDLSNSGDRSAPDVYDGWTDLPGKELILSGGIKTSGDDFLFTSKFTAGGFGSSDLWVSVWDENDPEEVGSWNDAWNTNRINSNAVFPPDNPGVPQTTWNSDWSDMYMNWTVAGQYDPDGSTTLVSSDFGNAAPIPEPLTALALFATIGSLGAYIRRRRA